MITFLIEVLELPNLITRPNIQYNMSQVTKFCWCHHRQKLWHHNFYFKKNFILRRRRVSIVADIIRIGTMSIKIIFKDLKKGKRTRNNVSKYNIYLYFLKYQNFLISGEKMLMSAELEGCVTWFIYFLDLL